MGRANAQSKRASQEHNRPLWRQNLEWLDRVGEGEAPSEGVSSGSGWIANRVTSVNEGRKLVSLGFVCFQVVLAYEV